MSPEKIGLGHAFEIDPEREDGFLLEIAQAQLIRQLFPRAPLKYMPPTRHMTGNIFQGYLMDGMFNLASVLTGQNIQLLGMLTEAIHTPFLQDRALAIENARYIFNNARHLQREVLFQPDGQIQSREAARMLAEKIGLREVEVVHQSSLGEGFIFFILYGQTDCGIDLEQVRASGAEAEEMSYQEVNQSIRDQLGRKLVVVGACTGYDAHTVGLDAILNMKGYAGEYGLERYDMFRTYNLGSQISNQELIRKGLEVRADALLVSQVVTQKEIHIKNLTALTELLEAEGLRDRFLLIVGGPRISNELALELGYDAGFGPGTIPLQVAAYLAQTVADRRRD